MGRLFDDVARRYDFLNDVFSCFLHRHWRKTMIAGLDVGDGFVTLDVCTGTADSAIALAVQYPRGRVIGVDISEPMLRRARLKARGRDYFGRIMFCLGDGLAMPFPDNSFDVMINSFGLRNQTDFSLAIQEMVRVLKPAGEIRILEFSLPENIFLRRVYLFYLGRIMPGLSALCGAPAPAYTYLSRSIQDFISRRQVIDLMGKKGLTELGFKNLCAGIVCCYHGIKAARK